MTWIALRMFMGDKSKYFAILFGVSFACFLIAEQSAAFCGIMLRTTSQIRDTDGADIWVMNSDVRYVDDLKPISDNDLFRVRSVPGVAWAVNLYRGQGQAQLADGTYQGVSLMGLDDASLTGAPTHMLLGKVGDLPAGLDGRGERGGAVVHQRLLQSGGAGTMPPAASRCKNEVRNIDLLEEPREAASG
jgi:putative ABC transport system permease protein